MTEAKSKSMDIFLKDLSELSVGDIFSFEGRATRYILLEVKYLGEHRDNVWAYGSFPDGEFEGLLRDGACDDHYPQTVEFHGHKENIG